MNRRDHIRFARCRPRPAASLAARSLAVIIFCLSAVGCGALGLSGHSRAGEGETRFGPGQVTALDAQSEIMSFADSFNGLMAQQWNAAVASVQAAAAADGPGAPAPDELTRARRTALETRLAMGTSVTTIAASPNPIVAVADLVTVVSLQRMVLEDEVTLKTFGPVQQAALVAGYKAQEARAWRIAERVYTPEQCDDLRRQVAQWRAENPQQRYVAQTRLEDFARNRQQYITADNPRSSVLSVLGLDPLAGLDPTLREVQKTRLLGERAFYFASRSPPLLKLQFESLAASLLQGPEIKQTLAATDRASRAADRLAVQVEQLPANIAAERQAALDSAFKGLHEERIATLTQFFEGLTAQRQSLIHELDEKQGNLQTTVRELRATVDSASQLSESISTTIREAQAFATTVVPTESLKPASVTAADKDFLAKYQQAVEKTGETIGSLNQLAARFESLAASPAIDRQVGTIQNGVTALETSTEHLIDRAFYRLLVLAIVVPVATVASVLLFRRWRS